MSSSTKKIQYEKTQNRNIENKAGTLARTTREDAVLEEFPSQGCSLLGWPPHRIPQADHEPTDP